MRFFLFILASLSFLAGLGILVGAKSALHEIEAFIFFLICAVLFSAAAVVEVMVISFRNLESRVNSIGEAAKIQVEMLREIRAEASNVLLRAEEEVAKDVSKQSPPDRYYVSIDGNTLGPYTIEKLRELRQSGELGNNDLIAREGETDWRPISESRNNL